MNVQNKKIYLIALLAVFFLAACGGSQEQESEKTVRTVEAKTQPVTQSLYYSGKVAPLKTIPVSAPMPGTVLKTFFLYGDEVKKGQNLFEVTSSDLQKDLQDVIASYVKSKNDFISSFNDYSNSRELFRLKFISEDEYNKSLKAFQENKLSLLQAQEKLKNTADKAGLSKETEQLVTLGLSDIDSISKAMHLDSQNVLVVAPADGVILASSDDKGTNVGTQIKDAGDLLAKIGDMSGVSITVSVDELSVNKIKAGMPVTITGPAFPGVTLRGKVFDVSHQAKDSEGFPGFTVVAKVDSLTPDEQKIVHTGMSVKMAITLKSSPQIQLPINAVREENGEAYVDIIDPNSKKTSKRAVTTGPTSLDQIAILSGIKEGEMVVIHD